MVGRTGADLAADANGDMVVNTIDLAYLHASFGGIRGTVASGSGSVAAVPEPDSAVLFTMGIAAIFWRAYWRSAHKA